MQDDRTAAQRSLALLGPLLDIDDVPVRFTELDAPVLGSPFLVSAAAAALAAGAIAGVAALQGARRDTEAPAVEVGGPAVAVAVRSERFLRRVGEEPESLWDPVSGNYPTTDGWIRIHANYPHHRAAALRVLGTSHESDAVARTVGRWTAVELEEAIADEGGCAAAYRTLDQWYEHPHGATVRHHPVVSIETTATTAPEPFSPSERPLDGVRILDLARVIAGPVASRVLAAYGADVLRVEQPHWNEMLTLVIDGGFGKRSTRLDLGEPDQRAQFDQLVSRADVVVHAFRPGAFEGLGYDDDALQSLRPGLVVATLSAYGAGGPWAERRGFDSLVQMATGIDAEAARLVGSDQPVALPAQLLDHGTGLLLAAGITAALRRRAREGGGQRVEVALARTAAWLDGLGRAESWDVPDLAAATVAPHLLVTATPWGDVEHARVAGRVEGVPARWDRPPPVPGSDPPHW